MTWIFLATDKEFEIAGTPLCLSVLYIMISFIFFFTEFPECKFPYKFDLIGASHQLWHVGIVLSFWKMNTAFMDLAVFISQQHPEL